MVSTKKFRPRMLREVVGTLVKAPATVKYPVEKPETPASFRGRIVFDSKLCVGCKMCMRDCPAGAILIEPYKVVKQFKCAILLDRCLFCAQCVDSCPRNALATTPEFELTCFDRKEFKDLQT